MLRDKGIVEIIKEVETKDIMEEVVKLKLAVRDDTGKYIKRVKDLDNPLPLDCSWFLPFRPNTVTPPKLDVKKPPFKEQIPLTVEEKAKLKEEYYESVKHSAEKTFDSFCTDGVTEILPGKAWVVPNLLSKEECELIIKEGEASGMKYPTEFNQSANVRTSRRTDNWDNQGLSKSVVNRLSEEILSAIEATSPYTSVRGIHPNWRVASYSRGQAFPAHIDQSDSVMVQHPEKVRQRFTSSHTLLIYLSQKEEQFKGGATRLFPAGDHINRL